MARHERGGQRSSRGCVSPFESDPHNTARFQERQKQASILRSPGDTLEKTQHPRSSQNVACIASGHNTQPPASIHSNAPELYSRTRGQLPWSSCLLPTRSCRRERGSAVVRARSKSSRRGSDDGRRGGGQTYCLQRLRVICRKRDVSRSLLRIGRGDEPASCTCRRCTRDAAQPSS